MRSSGAPSAVSDDDSGMKISVSPPPPLEESSHGLHGVFPGPSPPAQVHLFHAPGLPWRRRRTTAPLHEENHITPPAVVSPSLLVHPHASVALFNPLWPVLVPPGIFSSARHTLFCPVLMSQPGPASSRAPGDRPDASLKLLPAPQMIRASVQGCETPRLFSCGPNSSGHRPQPCSGKVKKDLPLQDLPGSAVDRYWQIMDDLGLKVTEGSEARDEEDECVQYINQLLDDSQSMTEASLDMDFIAYLLSTDVLRDDPEAVAGCSDWTCSTVSEAPPSDAQPFNGTDLLLTEDPMMKNILAPFQDNVEDQTGSQMFTERKGQRFQTDLHTSVQEPLHPDLQDCAPETDYK